MADTNIYTSKQNIKKYTTQAKFDAMDKSGIPVGTEYNIVGQVEESDLSSELQTKINNAANVPTWRHCLSASVESSTIFSDAGSVLVQLWLTLYSVEATNTELTSQTMVMEEIGADVIIPASGTIIKSDDNSLWGIIYAISFNTSDVTLYYHFDNGENKGVSSVTTDELTSFVDVLKELGND